MRFLQPDSPLMRFCSKMADIMLINALFLICSLPVLTAGAAMTAAHKVSQDIIMKKDPDIVKTYFRAFRSDFLRSTAAWILTLLTAGLLIYDTLLVFWYLEGGLAVSCYALILMIAVLLTGTSVYVFALLARYSNPLTKQIRNAFLLALGGLPRTAVIAALALLPVAVPFFFTGFFIRWMWLWFLLVFGLSFAGISSLTVPVFNS